jgi:hypothetical protein
MVGGMRCFEDLAQPWVLNENMTMEHVSMKEILEKCPYQHSFRDEPQQTLCAFPGPGTRCEIKKKCGGQGEHPEGAKSI